MKRKNSFLVSVLLIQFFSLFSNESSSDGNNSRSNTAHIEMHSNNYQNPQSLGHCCVYVALEKPKYHSPERRVSDTLGRCSFSELTRFFDKVIMSVMCIATIKNYYCAIPGYSSQHGLRDFFVQPSQLSHSGAAVIKALNTRLESYFTRIEKTLFDRQGLLCEPISRDQQIKLAMIYADFLKEFYFNNAKAIFEKQAHGNSVMQDVLREVKWDYISTSIFDGKDCSSSIKKIEQQYAGSVNGNFGKVYRALHEGNSEKAHTIGQEKVTTVVGRKQTVTSVFERYPELHQKVEQVRIVDRAKAEQLRIAQEAAIKRDAINAQVHYEKQNKEYLFQEHPDLLKDRCNAVTVQMYDPRFFERLHTVLAEHAARINPQHLTVDQKGILCQGGHLQHYLVDEAISVVDTAISGDLIENMQGAVIDLANASLTLNKEGDVIMASRTLDACWALVDHAHDAARCAYSTIITHAPFVAKGMADGVRESLHGAVHVVCHPLQAAQEAAQSLAVAGYYLGKLAYSVCAFDAACDLFESDPEQFEQKIREHLIDPEAFVAVYEHAKNNISSEDIARVGTRAVVDMMLLHGATKAVSAIAKESWPALISCMRKGEQSAEVALTAENIPVQCGQEIAALMENMQNASGGVATSGLELEKRIFSATEKISHIEIKNPVLDNIRTGSALKKDIYHAFNDIVDNYAGIAKEFDLVGNDKIARKLYQIEGYLDGVEGIFEWIVDPNPTKGVTHRLFIKGIKTTGRPNAW